MIDFEIDENTNVLSEYQNIYVDKGVVENNKLVTKTYTTKDCSGQSTSAEIGDCNTCHVDPLKNTLFVQCGTISKMILVILAVLFFLF